ncbi:sugar ABC transporter permease [Oscillochloris sp. ZM17-4]|uniref:carbohydrate ABC transporter permease n=1 Tax=Oscillochloris sp. ZM17-4 TaxID=2866714 RepID=UPI001C72E27D|nr:sugar ABC transporter permease [Oscillochloris sp. ZM17-4]MBX0327363.1 sugar ABC transporter permease [Oscillochloris sp. ZM17-4]
MATATPAAPAGRPSRARSLARREAITAYLFIAPYLIVAAVFTVGLLVYAFGISFTSLTASFAAANARFVGIDNYLRAMTDADFLAALGNAFWYFVIVSFFQTIGAILLAVTLNAKLQGMRVYRTLLYSPSVASSIVMSLIFLWLYLPTGFINYLLGTDIPWLTTPDRIFAPLWGAVGLGGVPAFLQGPSVAWASIMVLSIFTTIPTFMVMFLTALQDVPGFVYEAAAIDGATGPKAFWYITLPLLRPVIALVVILGTIGTFQVFDQVAILTKGGPLKTTLTPAFLIYQKTLGTGTQAEAGFAAAMAFILAFVIVAITLVQRRMIEQD